METTWMLMWPWTMKVIWMLLVLRYDGGHMHFMVTMEATDVIYCDHRGHMHIIVTVEATQILLWPWRPHECYWDHGGHTDVIVTMDIMEAMWMLLWPSGSRMKSFYWDHGGHLDIIVIMEADLPVHVSDHGGLWRFQTHCIRYTADCVRRLSTHHGFFMCYLPIT